jgi:hypothetical protein
MTEHEKNLMQHVADLSQEYSPSDDAFIAEQVECFAALGVGADVIEKISKEYNKRLSAKSFELAEIMHENGMSEVTLANGQKMALKRYYNVSQANSDSNLLRYWLIEQGMGSIMKGKAYLDEVQADLANERGFKVDVEYSVASATLKAALTKHLEAGGDFPPEEACKVTFAETVKVTG